MSKFSKKVFTTDNSNTKFEGAVVEAKKEFKPTEEQVLAKDLVLNKMMCAINAVSGSGKTSTFVYISSFLPQPSLYMTFNVTMAREAAEKFGTHVSCMTTHSLAYRKVGKGYQHKLSRPHGRYVNVALTGNEVARFFLIPDFPIQGEVVVSKGLVGLIIKSTVDSFEMSAEPSLEREHIPYHYIKDLDKKYGKDLNKSKFMKLIHRYAKSLWEERTDKYSEVCCKHNTYLKLYQLSKPNLAKEYEVIYLDEAQDLNPVTRDIILQQEDKCKLIFTGDRFQQIYAWNGSVNSLQSLGCSSATLTKSFRFGTKVAQLAELILDGEAEVNGFEEIDTKVGLEVVDTTKPYTILFRTNMELIFTAVSMISKGDSINVNIDMKDFVAMLKSADALYKGNLKQVKHENIVPFATWGELEEEGDSDRELGRLVSIVSDGSADNMIKVLHEHTNKSSAHITLTSAHKAKGLEYPQVILASDFPSNYNSKGEFVGLREEERNLLYVATTRAMQALNINKTCQEFYDVKGIEIGGIIESNDPEELCTSTIDEYYEDGRVRVGDTIFDSTLELLASECADEPWYDPDNDEWMNQTTKGVK